MKYADDNLDHNICEAGSDVLRLNIYKTGLELK